MTYFYTYVQLTPVTTGRPVENNGARPDPSERRLRFVIATLPQALRRSLECKLRTLVGVMDHAAWPPRHQRHVQRIDDQLLGE